MKKGVLVLTTTLILSLTLAGGILAKQGQNQAKLQQGNSTDTTPTLTPPKNRGQLRAQEHQSVETRNKIKMFLIGTDYKNLGALRSELVHTRNRLEQLKRLMEQVENEEDRLQLQNQIQETEREQKRIRDFIKEQEGKFSLFGWLVKIFLTKER